MVQKCEIKAVEEGVDTKTLKKKHENHLIQHYKLFYRCRMWLEGMMGAGNTNTMCCGWGEK